MYSKSVFSAKNTLLTTSRRKSKNVLEKFGIKNNIYYIVSNGCRNNNGLSDVCGEKLNCIVHGINLVFSDLIKNIPELNKKLKMLNKVSKTCQVSHSTRVLLKKKCEENDEKYCFLATFCKTRFNSCCKSLETALQMEKSKNDTSGTNQFTNENWV
ncbi:hypothetical protein EIN_239280 [Entamoeba invadens IP1]|uniref:Uncharacterized protein n=1 Tax=Entamoeba invadens IP1 TaxID=370355 RepID=A0A0A1UFT6_ENTIV|nr:hypothetical protein EIN_239280 [Entamoeba invadens IP1]ELP93628.1 hypothetical protein EIN_239280 [Entamoeba invadens IP1]|eukprot:XP_004260399.1 hypothetical protein EIN_239280 [Entamoeba invadens IP1]